MRKPHSLENNADARESFRIPGRPLFLFLSGNGPDNRRCHFLIAVQLYIVSVVYKTAFYQHCRGFRIFQNIQASIVFYAAVFEPQRLYLPAYPGRKWSCAAGSGIYVYFRSCRLSITI